MGEQLFISYGDRPNDELLAGFAFVEADNAHDAHEFDVGGTRLRARRRGRVALAGRGGGAGGEADALAACAGGWREIGGAAVREREMLLLDDDDGGDQADGDDEERRALARAWRNEKARLLGELAERCEREA